MSTLDSEAAPEPGKSSAPVGQSKGKISLLTRITSILVALILSFCILIIVLVFTQSGNALVWRQLTYSISPLSGEFVKGELLTGWTLKNLKWSDQALLFSTDEAKLEWHFSKLLKRELPIQLIRFKNSHLIIFDASKTTNEQNKTQPDAEGSLTIPFNLRVSQLYLDNFSLQSPDAELSLGTFNAQILLKNNQLTIPELLIDQLHLTMETPNTESPSTSESFSFPDKISFSKSDLPDIQSPIPIALDEFLLTNAFFKRGDVQENVDKLALTFNWTETKISSLSADLQSTRVDALLSGKLQLSDDYPLDIKLETTLHDHLSIPELKGIEGQKISLRTSGDVNNLNIDLSTNGAITAKIDAQVSPLKPNIPLNLQVSWEAAEWPLKSPSPQFASERGSLTLVGDLEHYALSANMNLHAIGQPSAQLNLISTGNIDQLAIKQLSARPISDLNSDRKAMNLTGTFNWKQGIQWQGLVELSALNPELWLPEWPGMLNGSVQSQLSWHNEKWKLEVDEMNVNGSLLNHPVSAKGTLQAESIRSASYALPFTANIDTLTISYGDNHLQANGILAEKVSLQAEINAQKLSLLHQNIAGQLQGGVQISGSSQKPSITYSINSPTLNYQGTSIKALSASGNLTKGKMLKGSTQVTAKTVDHKTIQLHDVDIAATGNELKHTITLNTSGNPIAGNLTINGTWKNQQWNADIPDALFVTPVDKWTLKQPITIQINSQNSTIISEQCWLSNPAKLCLGKTRFSPNIFSTRFDLTDLHLSTLQPLFPNNFRWDATLNGQGEFKWLDGIPTAKGRFQTTPGTLINETTPLVSVTYQELKSTFNLDSQKLIANFDFASNVLGTAQIDLSVSDIQNQQHLAGKSKINRMTLNFLQPLIPDIKHINGRLSSDTRLAGTLKAPQLYGDIELSEGSIVTRGDAVKVSDMFTTLTFEGDHGLINGHLKAGDGEMTLSGDLSWKQQPLTGQLIMKGDNLEARYPGILQLKTSPDLTLQLGSTDKLSGTITIPWARIRVKQLPKQAIKPSDDVVIISSGSTSKVSHSAPPFSVNINIVLGQDINIDAYGLKADLAGHLRINQQPEKPLTGNGSIQLLKGRYHQFGQDLLIKEGNIIFSGHLSSPYLAVNAIRNPDSIEDSVTVGLQVSGPPDRPEFSIYSDPSMPQEEQWSYLLRGYGLKGGDDSAVQAMLISFGVSQFGGVVNTLGEAVGISDVTLATQGSGDDTQVTIGGTLAPGLRVQYGAGVFNSIAEIKVRYELMPRLYLQAVSGVAQAVDLFYQFKIESKPPDKSL